MANFLPHLSQSVRTMRRNPRSHPPIAIYKPAVSSTRVLGQLTGRLTYVDFDCIFLLSLMLLGYLGFRNSGT